MCKTQLNMIIKLTNSVFISLSLIIFFVLPSKGKCFLTRQYPTTYWTSTSILPCHTLNTPPVSSLHAPIPPWDGGSTTRYPKAETLWQSSQASFFLNGYSVTKCCEFYFLKCLFLNISKIFKSLPLSLTTALAPVSYFLQPSLIASYLIPCLQPYPFLVIVYTVSFYGIINMQLHELQPFF